MYWLGLELLLEVAHGPVSNIPSGQHGLAVCLGLDTCLLADTDSIFSEFAIKTFGDPTHDPRLIQFLLFSIV